VESGKKGTIRASDDELESSVALFESAAVWGGVLVLLGLGAEIALLVWPADNERLAEVLASGFVALGVGIEVLFGKLASRRQGVLVQRSKERVTQLENANLLLKKQLGPRQVVERDFVKALEGWPKAPVEIMYVRDVPDCFALAFQISMCLSVAKWENTSALPIPPFITERGNVLESSLAAGGPISGVGVVSDMGPPEEVNDLVNAWEGKPVAVQTPPLALLSAIARSGLGGAGWNRNGRQCAIPIREGWLRIVVAPRP
jgi:hypothetical protein